MKINLVFDASAANAPSGFEAAAQAAANFYDALFTNPITVTIDVGWNEVDGSRIGASALAESETTGYLYNYAQVRQALVAEATSSADHTAVGTLPINDPTNGGQFFVSSAEAQALGLAGPSSGGPDGWVGISSAFPWTFDPNHRAVAGKFDAIGALEHEISEVLGRIGALGMYQAQGAPEYDPIDLFRWTSPGVRDLTPGPGWFSLDGKSMLQLFNDPTQGGDAADWDPSYIGDSYGSGAPGVANLVSPVDKQVMDVLGYDIAGQSAAFTGLERQYAISASGGTVTISGGPEGVTHSLVGAPSIAFADGALSFDANGAAAQFYDLWDAAFGTPANPGIAQADIAALQQGTTLAALADKIAGGHKFRNAVAGMSPAQIVTHVFETALRRAPTTTEAAQWTTYLGTGGDLGQMLLDIATSSEHVAITAPAVAQGLWVADPAYATVEYMFQAAFGGAPTSAELANWAPQVRSGMTAEALATQLAATTAFQTDIAGKSNQQIVDYFYATALHRAPDASGEAFWTSYLNAGHSVADLMTQFEQSPEFDRRNGASIAPGLLVSASSSSASFLGSFTQAMASTSGTGAAGWTVRPHAPLAAAPMLARPNAALA
ncbi:MAG TPA: NF038122 family metalloprotease [Caulobacteraceae bacterium]|nr:NF038122 family metalloprotease [Caulobacteraceae bacterium]